ncbi:hypothetical protein BDW60DRAFT_173397 [Aspergillus nidulans var. acristatus]
MLPGHYLNATDCSVGASATLGWIVGSNSESLSILSNKRPLAGTRFVDGVVGVRSLFACYSWDRAFLPWFFKAEAF